MGSEQEDPTAKRALALALMRQALKLLDETGHMSPALHLQMAIDRLLIEVRDATGA